MTGFNNVKFIILKDYEAASIEAAQFIAKQVRETPDLTIGFATGSTPEGAYCQLIRMHKEDSLDFSGVTGFNLDEYYPIKKNNPQSYHYFMQEKLFSHINIKPENCYIPNGETTDVPEECLRYEAQIRACGGIGLQILGIGTNGHIGFNEPAAVFEAETRLVSLVESTIEANSRFFESPSQVPRYGITMGIKSIMLAKKILLLASGRNKAGIIKKAFTGEITPQVPASILQLHPDVTVLLDEEAAQGVNQQ